ncbi:MAG: ferritin-like domain-containing protein [Cytophagales bacterium]|nr:ferritin-like domain-containing protein [Cytophagales bacterium]
MTDSSKNKRYNENYNNAKTLNVQATAKAMLAQHAARTHQPPLVSHLEVPKRSIHTPQGFAAMVHSIAHIEWNAIRLALDAVWRFDAMPEQYYLDWTRVAGEETKHFNLLEALLTDVGYTYGDFPAHDGLWHMCDITKHDIVARMALVPRTLEARGLDATPLVQAKLKRMTLAGLNAQMLDNAKRMSTILDIILAEEIGHVAIGNHWYRWLCKRDGLDPIAHYKKLALEFDAPRLRPPLNIAARLQAGFVAEELDH